MKLKITMVFKKMINNCINYFCENIMMLQYDKCILKLYETVFKDSPKISVLTIKK